MFKRIRDFQEKTREEYNKDYKKNMDAWKERVLKLHEKSSFLFYYENCELACPDGSRLIIQGDIAKDDGIRWDKGDKAEDEKDATGNRKPLRLYLYDGQGRLLGRGLLLSDPFEKEEKRRGFLRSRKHEFQLKITRLYGKKFSEIDESEKKKLLMPFYKEISLISDVCI